MSSTSSSRVFHRSAGFLWSRSCSTVFSLFLLTALLVRPFLPPVLVLLFVLPWLILQTDIRPEMWTSVWVADMQPAASMQYQVALFSTQLKIIRCPRAPAPISGFQASCTWSCPRCHLDIEPQPLSSCRSLTECLSKDFAEIAPYTWHHQIGWRHSPQLQPVMTYEAAHLGASTLVLSLRTFSSRLR